jgi:hypothetical protein
MVKRNEMRCSLSPGCSSCSSLLIATLLLLTFNSAWQPTAQAQTPLVRWAKRVTGTNDDVGNGIAVDTAGNTYVAGYFRSTNAAFGATILTNGGGADVFLAKYDFTGNVLWAKKAGGTSNDFGNALAIDSTGNTYVTGFFLSTNINFSGLPATNHGSADVFVAKYDPSGLPLWARAAGGSGYDAGNGIAVDAAGNSYVTGFFYSSNAVFGAITLTNSGQNNVFLAKYDSAGNVLWARQAGGASFDMGFAVAADSTGNSFITGGFFSTQASFGGAVTLTNSGENDVFVAKYDPSGTALWARQVKGPSDDFGYGIAVDGAGNSYVTGIFFSSVATFAAGVTLTNGGYNDIFLSKYDPAGNVIWARKAGGSSDDYSYAIALDATTNIYLTGNFYSTNANFGGLLLTNLGSHEAFVSRYDSAGNALWAKRLGGGGADSGNALATDVGGNCHLTGSFTSVNAAFDSTVLTNSGGYDIFVAQIDGDPPTLNFTRAGGQLLLYWPTNQLGYILESTAALSAGNTWSPVTNLPVIVGDQKFVTNTFSDMAHFRLRK